MSPKISLKPVKTANANPPAQPQPAARGAEPAARNATPARTPDNFNKANIPSPANAGGAARAEGPANAAGAARAEGPANAAEAARAKGPDVGAGLANAILDTPDTVVTDPQDVKTAPADAKREKALLYKATSQIAGLQDIRDLAAQEAPSPTKALAAASVCYAEAREGRVLGDIDAEMPKLFAKALMNTAGAKAVLGDNHKASAKICKEQLTALFSSTKSEKISQAKQFLEGLQELFSQQKGLDKDSETLFGAMLDLANHKLDEIAGKKNIETLDTIWEEGSALSNAYVDVNMAKQRLGEAVGHENNTTALDNHLAKQQHALSEAQTQCFRQLAGRAELCRQCVVHEDLDKMMGALLDGKKGASSVTTMMNMAVESPTFNNETCVQIIDRVKAFSKDNSDNMLETLGSATQNLHVRLTEQGGFILDAINLDAHEDVFRAMITNQTLEGPDREKGLKDLGVIMEGLRLERSTALEKIANDIKSLNLNDTQIQTLTTLLQSKEIAYNHDVIQQIFSFGDGLTQQLDTVGIAMTPDATVDQKMAGAHSLDMMLMDNPLLAGSCLALKRGLIITEGFSLSHTDQELFMARHEATHARAKALIEVQDSKLYKLALDNTPKAEGCDKHHVAALNMKKLMEMGVGTGRHAEQAGVMLFHAAWAEHVAALIEQDVTPEQSDEKMGEFLNQLPPKVQTVILKGFNDSASIEGAYRSGVTSKDDYMHTMRVIKTTGRHLGGSAGRFALEKISGYADATRAHMANERFLDLALSNIPAGAVTIPEDASDEEKHQILRDYVKDLPFSTKLSKGDQKDIGAGYIDALNDIEVASHAVDHNADIAEIMKAQGVHKLSDLRGDSMAVALQYATRILTSDIHDLNDEDIQSLGLSRRHLGDSFLLEEAIKHVDWGVVDNAFVVGTVLNELYGFACHDNNTPQNTEGFLAFAEKLGAPIKAFGEELRQAFVTLHASTSERQDALKNLTIYPSRMNHTHVDFSTMRLRRSVHFSTKEHEKDSPEEADSRTFTKLLSDISKHQGSDVDFQTMSDQLRHIIDTYRPKMDLVLMSQDRGKEDIGNTLKRIEKDVFHSHRINSALDTGARASTRSKTLGRVNTGRNLKKMQETVTKESAKNYNGLKNTLNFSLDKEYHGIKRLVTHNLTKDIIARRHTAMMVRPPKEDRVSMAVLQMSLLSAYEESNAKGFATFGKVYAGQLAEAGGAINNTPICQSMAKRLEEFGLSREVAISRARAVLVGYKEGLPRLLECTAKQAHVKDLEHEIQAAAKQEGEKVSKKDARYTKCVRSAAYALEHLKEGEAIHISTGRKLTLTVGLKELFGFNLNHTSSNEARNAFSISKDANGKPSVDVNFNVLMSQGLVTSVPLLLGSITGTYDGTTGIKMSFENDNDCAHFISHIFNNKNARDAFSYAENMSFFDKKGAGIGFLGKVDIMGAVHAAYGLVGDKTPRPRLEAIVSGKAAISHSTVRTATGKTTSIQTDYEVGAQAAVGYGGQNQIKIKSTRTLAHQTNSGTRIRMAGRDKSIYGLRAAWNYHVAHRLDIVSEDSGGKIMNGEVMENIIDARQTTRTGFRPADGNSTELALHFMASHGVPESVQKQVETWLKEHRTGPFSLDITNKIKPDVLKHKDMEAALKAAKDDGNFDFGSVILRTSQPVFSEKTYLTTVNPVATPTFRYDIGANYEMSVPFYE